jgi:ABC-type nitrate/sulfonate/bicarbonate transport system substrate-binding protein
VQASYEWIWPFLASRWDLPLDAAKLRKVGFTPDPLVGGAVDFYAAWIVNQPRVLEKQGIHNWVALEFAPLGLDDYMDVSVVPRAMAEEQPDLLRRYNWALARAMEDILNEPRTAAEITVEWARDADLAVEDVMRRFELERPLILGIDVYPPLHMRPEQWDAIASVLLRYGQIELPASK